MTYMEVTRMTNEIAKFTLRTDSELMKKLRIVADYNGRSEFEKKHGTIDLN